MTFTIILLLVVALGIFIFYKWLNTHKKVDYTFNNNAIVEIDAVKKNKNYSELESRIASLNSDVLTQTLDHLGLSEKEKFFLEWRNNAFNKDIAELALGVHYLHQAWRKRGHSVASEVSKEGIDGFQFYQDKAFEQLHKIADHSKYACEAYTRLIRAHMGYGQVDEAAEYFEKAIEKDPDKLWAYLAYSEVIQPKWGGNNELIADLLQRLPARRLIQQIVELKLITDSLLAEESYFEESLESVSERAKKLLLQIDKELMQQKETSVHRYVLFGYLFILSDKLGMDIFSKKYLTRINNNFALYPFGIFDNK